MKRTRVSLSTCLSMLLTCVACGGGGESAASAEAPVFAPIVLPAPVGVAAPVALAAPSAPGAAPAGAGAGAGAGALASAPLFGPTTHAIVIGLLQFADPSMTSFETTDRRDTEVARAFVARGVPAANVTTLLDAAATRAAVFANLARVADATPVGGTMIFYYAGHGARTSNGDVAYIAYDSTGDGLDTDGISVTALQAALGPRLVGKRILFLADCCHSGGLGLLATRLRESGAVAASLTSADASNLSTGNWTYSQVLLEGLRGDACLDANGDGTIAITELDRGVHDAMRFRESQRSGSNLVALAPSLAIAARQGPARQGSAAGRFMQAGDEVVQILSDDGTTATVRAYDYAGYRDDRRPLGTLTPIASTAYPVGAELSVLWGGRVWPARVTETDGDFARITYPGWAAYWDEWILADRVQAVIRVP